MKITQEVRDYANEHGIGEQGAIEAGMKEKSREFVQHGGEIYQKI